jgi:hypothetical protein
MDNPKVEIRVRFHLEDDKVPYFDKVVTSRQEAVELLHEGIWVKDTFFRVRKVTVLPPAKKIAATPTPVIA